MLIKWIKSWFIKNDIRYDLFSPKERHIYYYLKGKEGIVDVDPMVLEKRLSNIRTHLVSDLKVVRSPVSPKEWRDTHYEKALDKVRMVFDVKPYAEGGLLESELFPLLDHFVEFIDTIKKNSRMFQTSVVETSPVTEPTVTDPSPTTNTLDSGSIVKEPSTEPQEPLPTEPALPSVCTIQEESIMNPLPTVQEKQP